MSVIYRILFIISHVIMKIFYRFDVTGSEKIADGPAILAANHVSYLDTVVVGLSVKRQVYFMAKAELFKVPVLSWMMRKCGTISINRYKPDKNAIQAAIKVVKEGNILGIFPQGTRTEDMGQFSRGIGLIAQKTGAPIYPIRVVGTDKAFKKGSIFPFRFPKIYSVVGDAISSTAIQKKDEQMKISSAVMESISLLS